MENYAELLMNMFDNGCDAVFIIDADWNIIAQKYTFSFPKWLPEFLNVPENCWTNTENEIYLNKKFYHYQLYCSEPNQCRVLTLKECPLILDAEDVEMKTAVHSLQQIKKNLEANLSPQLSNSIERISLLIYRKPYLHSIIKAVRNYTIPRYPFPLQDALQQLKEKLSVLLENYAEITLDLPEQKIIFYENIDFFNTVLLAGMVLSHHERGYFHHIQISLSVSNNTAHIHIILKPDFHQSVNMSSQLEAFIFNSFTEEKELLHLFCILHQGQKTFSPPKISPSSFQLKFCIAENKEIMHLHSTTKILPSNFNDAYKLMLAPVYLSFLN